MSTGEKKPSNEGMSVLPFDAGDLTKIRVTQAGLARMMGVSRQTVSQWVKDGKISTYPDGTIDPQRAYKEYLLNSDPTRMRNRVLRSVTGELDDLKQINSDLATQVRDKHNDLQNALIMLAEQSAWLERFFELVSESDLEVRTSTDATQWDDWVQDAFDDAGQHAMQQDPAKTLRRLDNWPADIYQQFLPASSESGSN